MAVKLQAAALVAMVLLSTVSAVDPNAVGWFKAQATYYTSPGSGGDEGSCAFGRINERFATGRAFCAIPDNDGSLCGRCLEVKCDDRVVTNAWGKTWEYPKYQCNGESVIVMVSDNCPSDRNAEWCSKHMAHCDLSYEAFSKIVKVVDGIAATEMRWVECPGTLPPKCANPIKAYGACGDANGPYGCCGPYLKCTQKTQFYWQCLGDMDTNWNSGRQSSGPSDGGGTVAVTTDANRRRRTRKPTTTRRRNNPQKKNTPPRRGGGGRAIGHWGQCGGKGGPTGNQKGGRDGPWGGYYCQKGSCRRYNAWWWQCK